MTQEQIDALAARISERIAQPEGSGAPRRVADRDLMAIVEQVNEQLSGRQADFNQSPTYGGRRGYGPTASGRSQSGGKKGSFLWGAAAGASLLLAVPLLRPVLRAAVKGGIQLGRYAKEAVSTAKEELEDITAEAKADLNSNNSNPD